ncbi:MAG: LysR family transcriptional regulator [Litoreibacter sp.]|nr:LysR family transcriptional regulator [Litoreibacter sp.]
MRPTLRQLEYLLAVADTGRFGAAAARLNVSQPSLSAQVAETETDLGLRVFNRSRSGTTLTPGGVEVVRRARQILRDVEDLRASVKGEGIFEGRLRLGVLPSIGPYLLPNVVRRLHLDYPAFRLVVREEATQDLEDGLRKGRFDMIISTPEDHPGTLQIPLFEETFWAGFAKDDPLAAVQGPIVPSDLKERIFLTLGARHRLSRSVAALATQNGGYVSDEYEGTSLEAIRLMAAVGSGVAILPQIYAMTEARRGTDIVLRKIQDDSAWRQLSLIQPSSHELRPGSEALASVLTAEAQKLIEPV